MWGEVTSLTLTLGDETEGVANEFVFQFTSGATATSLTLPDDIKWANGKELVISQHTIYQISILNGLASALIFDNSVSLIVNRGVYNEGDMMSGATVTFDYPVASDLTILFQTAEHELYVLQAGQNTLTVEWFEPSPPVPYNISPDSDGTYLYVLA